LSIPMADGGAPVGRRPVLRDHPGQRSLGVVSTFEGEIDFAPLNLLVAEQKWPPLKRCRPTVSPPPPTHFHAEELERGNASKMCVWGAGCPPGRHGPGLAQAAGSGSSGRVWLKRAAGSSQTCSLAPDPPQGGAAPQGG
jgi:hypothetical protein